MLDISVILPCYNESLHLPITLEALASFLGNLHREYEIIVSDDGSSDATPSLNWSSYHDQFRARYVRSNVNAGKGAALRQGLLAHRGRIVFFTDADLPVELEALARCLSKLENNECDIVIGDRRLAGSKAVGSSAMSRRIASKLFNIGVQLLVLPGYTDTQCCMKGFSAQALHKVLPASSLTSYAFDVELLYLAKLQGLRIERIPVVWKDSRASLPLGRLLCFLLACLIDVWNVRLSSR